MVSWGGRGTEGGASSWRDCTLILLPAFTAQNLLLSGAPEVFVASDSAGCTRLVAIMNSSTQGEMGLSPSRGGFPLCTGIIHNLMTFA